MAHGRSKLFVVGLNVQLRVRLRAGDGKCVLFLPFFLFKK